MKLTDVKYSIETTDNSCIERLQLMGKTFETEYVSTDYGSKVIGKPIIKQLEDAGFRSTIIDKAEDILATFLPISVLQLRDFLRY